jgi:predicted alpha/beta-fold hydrolase
MVKKTVEKARRFPDRLKVSEVLRRSMKLRDFDEITARMNGFASVSDYYERACCRAWISRIRTPTLVINADDDPLVPVASVPRARLDENPWVDLIITRGGGHTGFIAGSIERPRFWAEHQALRWARERIGAGADETALVGAHVV